MDGTGKAFLAASADPIMAFPQAAASGRFDFAHMASIADPTSRLGAPQSWPAPLLLTLRAVLAAEQPVLMFWGADTLLFWNAAAPKVMGVDWGGRAMARPASEFLASWPFLAPQIESVLRGGGLGWGEVVVPTAVNGAPKKNVFECSHTPVVDPSAPTGVGGVMTLIKTGDAAGRLEEMFEQTPGFACMLRGPEHIFDLANEAYRRLVGGRPLVGRSVRDALPEIAGQGFLELLDRVRTKGERHVSKRHRALLHRGPGALDEVFVDFVYEPVRGADGAITGVFVQGCDVTDQVRAEARWRAIVEAAPGLVFVSDAEGAILFVNEQACALTGVPTETLRQRRWIDLLHPDVAKSAWEKWREAQLQREPFEAEYRFCSHDENTWRWHLLRVAPLRRPDGEACEWVGVATDIHERREAEQRLAANVRTFDRLITGNPFGIYVVDADFRIAYASEGARRTFGAGLHPVVGKNVAHALRTIWAEPFASEAVERFRRTLEFGESHVAKNTVEQRADRDLKEAYDWRIERIAMPDGRFGVVCYFHDLTERVAYEAKLREASERVQLALEAGAIVGVWDWDLASDRFTADDRFARAFGLDPELCRAGISLDEAAANIHPVDKPALMEAVGDAIRRGGRFARQYRVRRADGHYRWVEANGRVDHGPDGTPLRFPGVLLDIEARRAAEVERDQVKARLAALVEAIPGCVYCKDREGRMVFVNRGTAEIIGQPPQTCLGKTDAELLDDHAQAEAVMANDRRVLATGNTETFEEEVSWPDGRRAVFFSTKAPFRDASGEIVGLIGASIDITDRKTAEQDIRDSQARLRAALEAGKMGEYSIDLATGEITAAPRTRELFGFGDAAPRRVEAWLARTHPDDRAALRRELEKAAGSDASDSQHEFRVEHPVAGQRWLASHNEILRDPCGAPIAVRGLVHDVTARRLNEERLRDLNADLERRVAEALEGRRLWGDIIEANDAFIQAITPDFRLLAINRANADEYLRVYGKRPRVGDSVLEILADWPEQLATAKAIWTRALNGEVVIETGEYGDDALEKRWYEMKFSPLHHPDGRLMGALHISYEVTQRIRQQAALAKAQAELFEAQKMETIGQLTGGVAHDFNNLLAAILTNLDLAKKRIPDLKTATLIEGAVKGAERGAALSRRLLAFARRQELKVATVDVAALFDGMLDLLSRSLGPSIRIEHDFPRKLPAVRVDANQLELALLNIAVNARDAMPDGGVLSVSARAMPAEPKAADLATGDYVRIRIVDTGIGMDAATLRKATEPFFTTKGVGKGTGLGLSMAQGLAAQSGGALRLHSELGRGATVDLWLPQAAAGVEVAVAPPPTMNEHADDETPMKILVVDDDALVAMGTVAMLEDLGHAVIEANSGRKALDAVEQCPEIDLVITDHAMPGMTGCELAIRLQEFRPGLPIILATGYAELPAGRDPGLPRLAKPFRQDELIAALALARRAD